MSDQGQSAAELLDAAIGDRDIRPIAGEVAKLYGDSSEKWRRVIYRVLSGKRLMEDNAKVIGEFFDIPLVKLRRPRKVGEADRVTLVERRLEALEAVVASIELRLSDEDEAPGQ